jgi:molybdenum cofactor biosynthesis protein B
VPANRGGFGLLLANKKQATGADKFVVQYSYTLAQGGVVGAQDHEQQARDVVSEPIRCAVITISDTRTVETDSSGRLAQDLLQQAGHTIEHYAIVPDDAALIVAELERLVANGCQVLITSGGTGIAKRDTTFEAVSALIEKPLPGFGELFRMLSFQEIGAAAMLSRATAGLLGDSVLFCLPGSSGAVRLGLQQLIIPQLEHLVWEVLRQK